MAAPIFPSLFPRPPFPPHQPLCFPHAATWALPPPPVHFYPVNNPGPGAQFLQPPHNIIGAANFNFYPRPGPGFRGRGGYHQHRGGAGVRGRGRGWSKRGSGGHVAPSVEKKPPSPAEFSCKVCNKEYRCEESYQIHLQSHRKCDSCDFEAVPRVLKEHELLHFLPDELKLNSPEDIKKWREDRRKNYPTAENIAKKRKNDEEKKARGEVAKTPLYRYIKHILGDEDERFNRRGRKWGRGRGRGRGRGQGQRGGCHQDGPRRNRRGGGRQFSDRGGRNGDSTSFKREQTDSKQTDLNSSGTSNGSLSESISGNIISEEKSATDCEPKETDLKNGILNAILVDVATVASSNKQRSDQSEVEVEKTIDTSGKVASDLVSVCGDKESKTELQQPHSSSSNGGGGRGVGRKRRRRMEGRQNSKEAQQKKRKVAMGLGSVRMKKPTLLEKLLATEMRREQNAVLQCIHHVIELDFFGLNSKSSAK